MVGSFSIRNCHLLPIYDSDAINTALNTFLLHICSVQEGWGWSITAKQKWGNEISKRVKPVSNFIYWLLLILLTKNYTTEQVLTSYVTNIFQSCLYRMSNKGPLSIWLSKINLNCLRACQHMLYFQEKKMSRNVVP